MYEEPKVFYMRDNHTFRRLSADVEKAITELRDEFENGCSYGMVCSKSENMPGHVHAQGKLRFAEFEHEVRSYYAHATPLKPWTNATANANKTGC